MRKLLFFSLWLTVFLSGCSKPFDPSMLCSIYEAHPEWRAAVVAASTKWNVPEPTIMSIIRHESNFRADAQARKQILWILPGERLSSAYGFAQALDSTWLDYQRSIKNLNARRNNFSDSVDFVGWYLYRSHKQLGLKVVDGFRLYLAYHQGNEGYKRLQLEENPPHLYSTHLQNPRLFDYAHQVEKTRQQYAQQLPLCSN